MQCRFEMIDKSGSMEGASETEDGGILENINSTPIAKLLRMISALPEIRHEKVFNAREQIDQDRYDLGDNLDTAIDRVLEELLAED